MQITPFLSLVYMFGGGAIGFSGVVVGRRLRGRIVRGTHSDRAVGVVFAFASAISAGVVGLMLIELSIGALVGHALTAISILCLGISAVFLKA